MKKLALLAPIVLLGAATSANAQVNLTSASVTGPTGTVWNTTADNFYTLFLQAPGLGDFLNPNDEAVNAGVTPGSNGFLLAGDGFPIGTISDSDPTYTLTLGFTGGNTLVGTYTPLTNTFVGGSSFASGGFTYSLAEFSFRRNLGDAVSFYTAVPGGDENDYSGNFRLDAISGAVPEPSTWAMMIMGIGAVGFAMRTARRQTKVTFSAA